MRLGAAAALVEGRLIEGDVEVIGGLVDRVGVSAPGGTGIVVPGLIDLQVNGRAGVDFASASEQDYQRAGEALLADGVTAFLPTFVTAPVDDLVRALGAIPAHRVGPRTLGAHVEGPFLSPVRHGAHPREHLRAPDLELLRRLLDAGPVRQVTLAPELPGALDLIDELRARGVVVSCGHTDATAAQAHLAFDRGAGTVTHLFNAMRPFHHRDPGVGMAALARPDVTVQVIGDLAHLAPETVRAVWQAAGPRMALVSDAVAAAGVEDGDYELGSVPIHSGGGVVRDDAGVLAGSTASLLDGVRNLCELDVPLPDALSAATAVPAHIAQRADLGRIARGLPADLVVLDDSLEVRRVLVAGEERVANQV